MHIVFFAEINLRFYINITYETLYSKFVYIQSHVHCPLGTHERVALYMLHLLISLENMVLGLG